MNPLLASQSPRDTAQPSALPVAIASLAALGLGGVAWGWRKATALTVALLLGVFAFETAIHSVHHLSDPQQAGQCHVLSLSQHVTGDSPEIVGPETPLVDSGSLVIGCADSLLPDLPLRPDQGRAPPSLLA